MAVHTLQVRLGAGVTRIMASGDVNAKWVIFQNNAKHSMRLGDGSISETRGMLLDKGQWIGPYPHSPCSSLCLATWRVLGTPNDLLDVIYDDRAIS